MTIKINCFRCRSPLKKQGALLFSPPSQILNTARSVKKYDLCDNCYDQVREFINPKGLTVATRCSVCWTDVSDERFYCRPCKAQRLCVWCAEKHDGHK